MTDASRQLAQTLAAYDARIKKLEAAARTPQLQNASITGTSITVYDDDGETVLQRIGKQGDGTAGVVHVNGPTPPVPTAPVVTAATLGLTVTWDGATADDIPLPADFDHVAVHVSTTDGFTPDGGTLRATLNRAGDISLTPLTTDPHYVVLVAYSASGVASDPSVQTAGTPDAVVSTDILDGIVTTAKLADDAVTQAKIAAAAVGTTEIADDAVTTPKVVAGAIQTAQLDAGAVNADKIAANAVTTLALNALAVTADKIAANAITAGKIDAGAVTAETIAAGAITADLIGSGTVGQPIAFASTLESTNFVEGSAGWKIDGDTGNAEFNQHVTINSGDGTGGILSFVAETASVDLRGDPTQGLVVRSPAGIALSTTDGIIALNTDEVDVEGTLILTNSTDASTAAGNTPALVIGDYANAHARFDGNEIVAMASNGGAMANYFVNQDASTSNVGNVTINKLQVRLGTNNTDLCLVDQVSGASTALVLTSGSGVYATNNTLNGSNGVAMHASSFPTTSDARLKTSEDMPTLSGLEIVRGAPSGTWAYTFEPDTVRMGPIAQDIPEALQRQMPEEHGGALELDLGSLIGVLWGAVRALDAELDDWRQDKKKAIPARKAA